MKQKQEGALCFIKKTTNKLYIESYCQALHIKGKNTVVSVALTNKQTKKLSKKIFLHTLKISLSSYRCGGVCVHEAECSSQAVQRRGILSGNLTHTCRATKQTLVLPRLCASLRSAPNTVTGPCSTECRGTSAALRDTAPMLPPPPRLGRVLGSCLRCCHSDQTHPGYTCITERPPAWIIFIFGIKVTIVQLHLKAVTLPYLTAT